VVARAPGEMGSDALLEVVDVDLDNIARNYDPSTPEKDFDYWLIQFDFETLLKYLVGDRVIELGCGRGVLTEKLAGVCKELEVVEGAKRNIEFTINRIGRLPNVRFHESLWQEFEYGREASDVVFFMGLEHLDKRTGHIVVAKTKEWLSKGGLLHVVVPNAESLHRRVAYHMGMISDTHELSKRDQLYGHQVVYDRQGLFDLLAECGYRINHWEGVFLKPLPNDMMMNLGEDVIKGFGRIGTELPDYCAHIYTVCECE